MSDFGAWGAEGSSTSSKNDGDLLQVISCIGGYQDNAGLRSKVKSMRTKLMSTCQDIKANLQGLRDHRDRVQVDRLSSQFLELVKRIEGLNTDASNQVALKPLSSTQGQGSDERTPLNAMQSQQQQQNQNIDMDLAEQRKKDLLSVERDMTGLRDAFVDLNNLVQEQGEDIIRIENATSSTVDHTEDANTQLESALASQRSARKKCICLIVLFIIILLIITLIILFTVKPWEHTGNNNNNTPPPAAPAANPTSP